VDQNLRSENAEWKFLTCKGCFFGKIVDDEVIRKKMFQMKKLCEENLSDNENNREEGEWLKIKNFRKVCRILHHCWR